MMTREEVKVRDDIDWDAVEDACVTVACNKAKRIDGENWKVYSAGTVIRIDIQINHHQERN
jgi:hypothetical protein